MNLSIALALVRKNKEKQAQQQQPPPDSEIPNEEKLPQSKKPRTEVEETTNPSASSKASESNTDSSLQASILNLHNRFASHSQKKPPLQVPERNELTPQSGIRTNVSPTSNEASSMKSNDTNPSQSGFRTPDNSISTTFTSPSLLETARLLSSQSTLRGTRSNKAASSVVTPTIMPRQVQTPPSSKSSNRDAPTETPEPVFNKPTKSYLPSVLTRRSEPLRQDVLSSTVTPIPNLDNRPKNADDSNQSLFDPDCSQSSRRRPPGPAGYYARRQNLHSEGVSQHRGEQHLNVNVEEFLRATSWSSFLKHHELIHFSDWEGYSLNFQSGEDLEAITVFPVEKVLRGTYSPVYRVPGIAVVVKRVVDQDKNAYVLFADPTGEISGSVAHSVFHRNPQYLDSGTVWVLKDVSLICPSPKEIYLNIVAKNLVQIFSDNLAGFPTNSGMDTTVLLDDDPVLTPSPSPPKNETPPIPIPTPTASVSTPIYAPVQCDINLTQELVDEFLDEFDMSD